MEDNKEIKKKNSNTNTSGTQESEKSTSKAVISAEIIELLTEFVGVPSVNPGNQSIDENPAFGEKAYVQHVRELMEAKGYYCSEQEVLSERTNLLISTSKILGGKPIILLQTHSDVVEAKEMERAFCARVEQGKIWGRGSCDAKGQLCAMILATDMIRGKNDSLPFDICIALCCDEEFQHRGVDKFLDWEHRDKVKAVIVGEPTELHLAVACKGSIRFCIETTGAAAHTSMPEKGFNAIYLMAKIVQIIQDEIWVQCISKKDDRCGHASIAVSLIKGGEVVNAVPNHCVIHVDRRMIPGEHWEKVYDDIQSLILGNLSEDERKHVEFGVPYLIDPSYGVQLPEELESGMQEVMKRHGLEQKLVGLPYGCDASKLAKWEIPVFVFGPGSINQAHTEDEYIEISQIETAVAVLKNIILSLPGRENI